MPSIEELRISLDGIGHVLSDRKLAVPRFQRSYSWREKQVSELLQDIDNALYSKQPDYFIGNIVLATGDEPRPEVVDGQQRLATTTIILAAIRDYFFSKGDDRWRDIEHEYLTARDLRSQERVPKLQLNESDNDFFMKKILSPPDSSDRNFQSNRESHQRIAAASKTASEFLSGKLSKITDPLGRLIDLLEYIRDHVRVIIVSVPDYANAFTIFETLNDRGLELAITDLLKNHLFHKADNRIAEVQRNWLELTGTIESVAEEEIIVDFVRQYWSSHYGLTRERELFSSIKKNILSKQAAVDFSADLRESAKIFAALLNPDSDYWTRLGTSSREHIRTLNALGITRIRPLLLAVCDTFEPAEVKKTLKLVLSWGVRFIIVGGLGAGTLEEKYSNTAVAIRAGRIKTTAQLKKEMNGIIPSDAEFQSVFASASLTKASLARYILRALERFNAGQPEPEFIVNPNEEEVNLEHVLPKNRSLTDWPIPDDEAETLVNRIGNMALMPATPNNKLGNKSFIVKKPELGKSTYKLTAVIANEQRWGQREIEERQKQLAALATKTWPI